MTVEKPKPKQLLRPITTGADSAMNQSQFLAITCNSLEAREKSRVHGAIGFGFASHWLKNWRESFKPITKRSNRNHVITFDSHLKIALFAKNYFLLYLSAVYMVINFIYSLLWVFFFSFIHSVTHSLAELSTQSLSHVLAQPLDFLFRLAMAGGSHPLLHGVNIYVAQDCTG